MTSAKRRAWGVYKGAKKKLKPKVAESGPKWRTKEKKYSVLFCAGAVMAIVY